MSSQPPSSSSLKIFFYSCDLVGPQNACIGLGQALRKRGHRVWFLANEKFQDKFSKFGFELLILRRHENESKSSSDSGSNVIENRAKDFINSGFIDDVDAKEQMRRLTIKSDFAPKMYATCFAFEEQIRKLLEDERPDVVIYDSTLAPPSLLQSKTVPTIRLVSCNPLALFNLDGLPPFMSGLAMDSDRQLWEEFRQEVEQYYYFEVKRYQRLLAEQFHYGPIENLCYLTPSKYLNVYQFPEELDYHDVIQLPSNMVRVDAFCRDETEPYQLPVEFAKRMKPNDKLIYVSLGSMGSCVVDLMKKLVSILSKTPHWYIVSRGLLHDQYELADNMIGDVYVPQTAVLPLVDLVIHHGGNNTLTECFYFGKPMIVMPLFYDQLDNAQRVHEKGLGVRIQTHRFTEQELVDTINKLLSDQQLKQKMQLIKQRIRTSDSKAKACVRIEQVVENLTKLGN